MAKAAGMVLLVALVAMFAAGCGNDGDTTSSSGSSSTVQKPSDPPALPTGGADGYLSRAEFVEAANMVCAHVREENEEDLERFYEERELDPDQQLSAAQLRELGEESVLPNAFKQTREVINLGPEHRKFEDEGEAAMKAFLLAIEEGEGDPGQVAADPEQWFAEANRLVRNFGFTECEVK